MIGQTISHYKVIEKLGAGGMGVVYKAEDTKLKRLVALKFLPTELTHNAEAKERFIHEAQAASALDHPNICTIHEIDETDDGRMFIVMAYYEGETLQKKVNSGQLSVASAVEFAIQIAQGLAKAHEHGIVHRDLKPANIIITKDGVVKIVDFGLAKLASQPRLTKTGSTMGTMAYMSPEQARGEAVDHRTDIWALGVVLYEMLTGQLPFKGEQEHAMMYAVLNATPKPLQELRADVPLALEQIVDEALTKSAPKRYQSMNSMLDTLKTLEQELELGNAKAGHSIVKFLRKRRFTLYAASAVVLAVLMGVGFYLNERTKQETSINSIAVLPLENTNVDPSVEYLSDGITEALINSLGQLPQLKVISRTSVFRYKRQQIDLEKIAHTLDVRAILLGHLMQRDQDLLISMELVDVQNNNRHLWGEQYSYKIGNFLLLEKEIASEVSKKLRPRLSGEEKRRLVNDYRENTQAYQLYMKGRYFWNKRTSAGVQKSMDYFQQAIALDSTYALAYVGLADAYSVLGGWMYLEPKEAFPKAKAVALKALQLDDALAEAHAVLADCKYLYDRDWQGAEEEYQKAITLNPNYADAYSRYAWFLSFMRRGNEARAIIDKAIELDPLSLEIRTVSAWIYRNAREEDKAIEQAKEALEMDPNFLSARQLLFESCWRMGRNDEAFKHFMTLYSALYDLTSTELEKAQRLYHESGWTGIAHFMIAILENKSKSQYVTPWDMMTLYLILGENQRVLDYLERADQIHDPIAIEIRESPLYESLHSEPRYQALMKKVWVEK